MLLSKAIWNFKAIEETWQDNTIDLSPIMKDLLAQRGITSSEQATEFLSPSLSNLYGADRLTQMNETCLRVRKAIEQQEPILVYGDYDADGVSSTTLLLIALKELGANCNYYIPNRFTEGYGPNESAFRKAHTDGYRLIITVDNGIAAMKEADVAKGLGIDLIITDHHEPQEKLPDAFAILHPKCSSEYPFKELAGVGVAFKLAEQLLGYFPKQLLDLVAIGTIADLVPLVGENRIFAYYGLQALSKTDRPGLQALKMLCKIDAPVTEEDIGFLIGPRLNAVGRLQNADLAVQLLMSDNAEEAEKLANEVQALNEERKRIVTEIVAEAETMIDPEMNDGVIVVAKEGWNVGVLGIVASRLVRQYDRPAIVMSIQLDEQQAKGSARSIPAFDLFKHCMEVRNLFTHFGGHAQAAGMTLPLDNMDTLKQALNTSIHKELAADDFKQEITISKSLSLAEINESLIKEVHGLAPFGMANPKPAFHIKEIPTDIRQLGQNKKHLKMQFKNATGQLDSIGFGFGELYPEIAPQTYISIVGGLEMNEWNGIRKPQMKIEDLKIDEWQLFDFRGKKDSLLVSEVCNSNEALVVCQSNSERIPQHITRVTYEESPFVVQRVSDLYLLDLPSNLEQLEALVKKTQPSRIYTCFYVENSAYMQVFPTRNDFKWLYKQILNRQPVNLKKEMGMMMQAKGWTKDRIIFMLKVFFELGFVKIENGIIQMNPEPVRRDLQDSETYKQRVEQAEIEKTLYYSNYPSLKKWFSQWMEDTEEARKEEVTYGL